MIRRQDHISIHAAQEGCDISCCCTSRIGNYFNPRSPRGLRPDKPRFTVSLNYLFQSTQPKRAATYKQLDTIRGNAISIHAAQEGCDIIGGVSVSDGSLFQSTQPKRAATIGVRADYDWKEKISIHAAQEGCDIQQKQGSGCYENFNPRSPRGLRLQLLYRNYDFYRFQSTQPKRAATGTSRLLGGLAAISIHAAQEGCDLRRPFGVGCIHGISIHAAQEGCDYSQNADYQKMLISIHAAQEGCDIKGDVIMNCVYHFNPRSPRGLRPTNKGCQPCHFQFQSTQPKRAATASSSATRQTLTKFQSTQPKRAATGKCKKHLPLFRYFNPRSPRGLRRKLRILRWMLTVFQSTQPKRAATYRF